MKAGKGEIYVCQRCQTTSDDRATICHPLHSILVERSSLQFDEHGRVIDCAQSSGRQTFKAAKVAT